MGVDCMVQNRNQQRPHVSLALGGPTERIVGRAAEPQGAVILSIESSEKRDPSLTPDTKHPLPLAADRQSGHTQGSILAGPAFWFHVTTHGW